MKESIRSVLKLQSESGLVDKNGSIHSSEKFDLISLTSIYHKMKSVIAFIFLLGFQSAFGQNYIKYHQQIKQARLLSVQASFQESSALYQQTFEQFDFAFARDCIMRLKFPVIFQMIP